MAFLPRSSRGKQAAHALLADIGLRLPATVKSELHRHGATNAFTLTFESAKEASSVFRRKVAFFSTRPDLRHISLSWKRAPRQSGSGPIIVPSQVHTGGRVAGSATKEPAKSIRTPRTTAFASPPPQAYLTPRTSPAVSSPPPASRTEGKATRSRKASPTRPLPQSSESPGRQSPSSSRPRKAAAQRMRGRGRASSSSVRRVSSAPAQGPFMPESSPEEQDQGLVNKKRQLRAAQGPSTPEPPPTEQMARRETCPRPGSPPASPGSPPSAELDNRQLTIQAPHSTLEAGRQAPSDDDASPTRPPIMSSPSPLEPAATSPAVGAPRRS